MVPPGDVRAGSPRRGRATVFSLQAVCLALVLGWFATGHASAPDAGLQQLDVLTLHERVAGLDAFGGRATMVVLTCASAPARPRTLDPAYGLAVSTDGDLARRVALPLATRCASGARDNDNDNRDNDGYVLIDPAGFVRYRSYDPGWFEHAAEQEVLLGHLAGHG